MCRYCAFSFRSKFPIKKNTMINLTVTPQKVVICFVLALLTAVAVRFMLGRYRDLWFKQSNPKSLITFRTPLATYIAIGYPICLQGYLVTAVLLLIIALEIFLVLCL